MHFSSRDILLAVVIWFAVSVWVVTKMKTVRSRITEHMDQVLNQSNAVLGQDEEQEEVKSPMMGMLIEIGNNISLFSAQQREDLRHMLTRAGWRGPMAVSVLIGVKVVCGLGLAMTTLLYIPPDKYNTLSLRSLLFLMVMVLGAIIPEWIIKIRVSRRQTAIEQSLPDALDLMVICTNAGYSLGSSLQRTAVELVHICPALASELGVAYSELQLSGDSGTALRNLAERVGTPSVRSLVTTLLQSQQYGTPITQALRQLARSERTARMLRLEEKAAKLSTKITIPMMFFILPATILISAGPAIMNLVTMMRH